MLFDIAADPSERKNLICDPQRVDEFAELSAKLLAHMRRTGDPQTAASEAAMAK